VHVFVWALMNFFFLLPYHRGLGVREASFILLFGLFGVSARPRSRPRSQPVLHAGRDPAGDPLASPQPRPELGAGAGKESEA